MMAISTAIRYRARSQTDTFSILDFKGEAPKLLARSLPESFAVIDDFIARHQKILPGEAVQLISDADIEFKANTEVLADSMAVTDFALPIKSKRVSLSDSCTAKDDGFITDKDLLRYRVLPDDFIVKDQIFKSIQKADYQIFSKTVPEEIAVNDYKFVTIAGIKIRVLPDSLAVHEKTFFIGNKTFAESATATDLQTSVKTHNRVMANTATVTDDRIVGRSAIINLITKSESFVTTDRKTATFKSGRPVSAHIRHGIENS